MSHDSQRMEIEHIRRKISDWLPHQPGYARSRLHFMSDWLRPTMAQLETDDESLLAKIDQEPAAEELRHLINEELLGFPTPAGTYYDQFVEGAGHSENGLRLRYLRRVSACIPLAWRVISVNPGVSVDLSSLDGTEKTVVHDRTKTRDLKANDVLLTRLIDMPAGPMLADAVLKIEGVTPGMIPDDADETMFLLNIFALGRLITPAQVEEAERKMRGGAGTPVGNGAGARNGASSGSSAGDRARPGVNSGGNTGDNRGDSSGARHSAGDDESARSARDDGSNTRGDDRARHRVRNPSTDPAHEKVLERVRKLFALAQETDASPHEAEIALRRCQSLMSKYGITEADLETSAFGHAEITTGRTVPMHMKYLASAVSRLHDVLFVSGQAGFAEFRGFEVDASVARMTLDYLLDAVERALTVRKRSGDFPAGRSAAYDYRLAFASEVDRRVSELVKERLQEERKRAGTGTSLVVKKREIVQRECGGDLSSSTFRGRQARNAEARAAGQNDGASVSLERQVGGSPEPLALPES